jgi:hypothetical protein
MDPFHVWLRPRTGHCTVRVSGTKNARWLLDRLARSFVFKNSEAIHDDDALLTSTFQVSHSSQTPYLNFVRLLVAIPEVELMRELA